MKYICIKPMTKIFEFFLLSSFNVAIVIIVTYYHIFITVFKFSNLLLRMAFWTLTMSYSLLHSKLYLSTLLSAERFLRNMNDHYRVIINFIWNPKPVTFPLVTIICCRNMLRILHVPKWGIFYIQRSYLLR